jgi:hypothetical protein
LRYVSSIVCGQSCSSRFSQRMGAVAALELALMPVFTRMYANLG